MFTPECNERMITNRTCYDCDLWIRTIAQDAINPFWYSKLTIDGVRYMAKPIAQCEEGMLTYTIENINTGERRLFCNLKIQGVVPDYFRAEFPDNARIISEDSDC